MCVYPVNNSPVETMVAPYHVLCHCLRTIICSLAPMAGLRMTLLIDEHIIGYFSLCQYIYMLFLRRCKFVIQLALYGLYKAYRQTFWWRSRNDTVIQRNFECNACRWKIIQWSRSSSAVVDNRTRIGTSLAYLSCLVDHYCSFRAWILHHFLGIATCILHSNLCHCLWIYVVGLNFLFLFVRCRRPC